MSSDWLSRNQSCAFVQSFEHSMLPPDPRILMKIGHVSRASLHIQLDPIPEKALAQVIGESVVLPLFKWTSVTICAVHSCVAKLFSLPFARAEERTSSVDPTVKKALQDHLTIVKEQQKDLPVTLGTLKQIKAIGRILPQSQPITSYSSLAKGQYLVGIADLHTRTIVISVYNSEQMNRIQEKVNIGYAHSIKWVVFEMDEETEKELMDDITANPREATSSSGKIGAPPIHRGYTKTPSEAELTGRIETIFHPNENVRDEEL